MPNLLLSRTRPSRPLAATFTTLALAFAILLTACAPAQHRERSDRIAGRVVEDSQKKAMGETEPFSIAPASVMLRRQLLGDQDLPTTDAASYGPERMPEAEHWPEDGYPYVGDGPPPAAPPPGEPLKLSLVEALQAAAGSSRDYQSRKEDVFRAALDLDLERHEFRLTFRGLVEGDISSDLGADPTVSGATGTASISPAQRLKTGADLTGRLGLDVARLLAPNHATASGLFADASVSIPLLRGAGRHIVTEPLTQAERDTMYALWRLHRFRQTLAVRVASSYLGVLQQEDQVVNAEENYRRLITAAERARRLGAAGRLPEFQVDQAAQDELRARNRWISARETLERRRDDFKRLMDLPPDAEIELDRDELAALSQDVRDRLLPEPEHEVNGDEQGNAGDDVEQGNPPQQPGAADADLPADGALPAEEAEQQPLPGIDMPIELDPPVREGEGPYELAERRAIELALENRLDLRVSLEQVYDSQRRVALAADRLRAELTLFGGANLGQRRTSPSAAERGTNLSLRPDRGFYEAVLTLDLPLDRRAEAHAYRDSFISLERAARDFQSQEDQVKSEVREGLRNLVESRESLRIQAQAVALAERRVESTELFLQAGRAEIRDLLDAQESLLTAQNALTAALIDYRLGEIELQRDMGVLMVAPDGTWTEFDPEADVEPGQPEADNGPEMGRNNTRRQPAHDGFAAVEGD